MNLSDKSIISLHEVSQRWGDRTVLHDVALDILRGDFVAITGPNGGGKTTLLRILLKLLTPTRGRVVYHGPEGKAVSRLPIGYLPQKNLIDSRFPITVREVVASGLLGTPFKKDQERVEEMLGRVEMTQHASAPIGALSGGQLQRTLLGRALVSEPQVLVLDEPLSYVDKHFEQRIYDIIACLAPKTTIILVSHEMSVIDRMANRHIIVDGSVRSCRALHHGPVPLEPECC